MAKFALVHLSERSQPVICNPGDTDLRVFDFCIIEGEDGPERTGYISGFEHRCEQQCKHITPPAVLRRAEPREVRAWHHLKRREVEALVICKQKAAQHNLEIKVTDVRFEEHHRKVVFYFISDKRIDFRDLVKDLAGHFKARIELWQIGVRDEARKIGGLGVCGCHLCCSAWLKDFAPVSIRYAKAQDLQFSPTKLSGACGRLRCCLAYEHDQYREMSKGVPEVGALLEESRHGNVRIIDRNLLTRTLTVLGEDGQMHSIPIPEAKRLPRADKDQGPKRWKVTGEGEPQPDFARAAREENGDAGGSRRERRSLEEPPAADTQTSSRAETAPAQPAEERRGEREQPRGESERDRTSGSRGSSRRRSSRGERQDRDGKQAEKPAPDSKSESDEEKSSKKKRRRRSRSSRSDSRKPESAGDAGKRDGKAESKDSAKSAGKERQPRKPQGGGKPEGQKAAGAGGGEGDSASRRSRGRGRRGRRGGRARRSGTGSSGSGSGSSSSSGSGSGQGGD